MGKASEFLTKQQQAEVEKAVIAAEKGTSVEIVPVIAASSGRYDRAEDLAGFWLGVLLMVSLWILWPAPPLEPGDWGPGMPLHHAGWLAALVGGFFIGAALCARTPLLRRLMTPKKELEAEVQRRAREVFFDQRVHHTVGATGVLIYISLFERMVCILADETVLKALPEGEITRLCDRLRPQLAETPATGLVETIDSLGKQLAGPLPRTAGDRDELANVLVTID